MVQTKRMVLEIEIEIDVPMDIVEDEARIEAVEEGLGGGAFQRVCTTKECRFR
ncbi:MAG: hypothetical protein AB1351_08700 [Thermoproteota archaeon]